MEEEETYSLDESPNPGLDLEEHSQRIQEIIDGISSLGLNVNVTRLPKYLKFLEKYQKIEDFDPENKPEHHDLFDRLQYTYREIHELLWIWNGIKISEPKGLRSKLEIVVGGHEFAKDDKNTAARNHQLELRIASYFLRNNYEVDLSSRTDVICSNSKIKFFIECKRLYSEKTVSMRVKEAAKQLKVISKASFLSKKAGIAVFDVTKLAFPHQGLTWGVTNEHCKNVIQRKLHEIQDKFDFTSAFESNKNIIGVWLQIHIPSLNMQFGQGGSRFSSKFLIFPRADSIRYKHFVEFQKVYEVYDSTL